MRVGQKQEAEARVLEALPNQMYKVELTSGEKILCHLPGSTRMRVVHLMSGDRVVVEISPYDSTRGRITNKLVS